MATDSDRSTGKLGGGATPVVVGRKQALTKKLLDALEREAKSNATTGGAGAAKERLIPDGDQPRMYACVRKGGAIVFQLRYRVGTGRGAPIKVLKLGTYGEITIDQARTLAKAKLGEVATGADPAKTRDESRHHVRMTLGALADAYFAGPGDSIAPTTRVVWKNAYKNHLAPRFATSTLRDITTGDVRKLHHAFAHQPRTGNQLLTLLTVFWKFATVELHLTDIGANPAKPVKHYKTPGRTRSASRHEYRRLGLTLERARLGRRRDGTKWALSPSTIAATEMILLTGWRKTEVFTLRWAQIDWANHKAERIPTKTGPQDRILGASVMALLKRQPRIEGNPFIFAGEKPGTSLHGTDSAWKAIRADARITKFTLHDSRHSFVTEGVNLKHSVYAMELIVGHANAFKYAHPDMLLYQVANETSAQIARYLTGRRVQRAVPRAARKDTVTFDTPLDLMMRDAERKEREAA